MCGACVGPSSAPHGLADWLLKDDNVPTYIAKASFAKLSALYRSDVHHKAQYSQHCEAHCEGVAQQHFCAVVLRFTERLQAKTMLSLTMNAWRVGHKT